MQGVTAAGLAGAGYCREESRTYLAATLPLPVVSGVPNEPAPGRGGSVDKICRWPANGLPVSA